MKNFETPIQIKYDCRFFIGEKPCKAKRFCDGCHEYDPMGFRILIIKLGAMGDVLRTTPILAALREKYKKCHITWMVEEGSLALLKHNPYIDRILPYRLDSALRLLVEQYDLLISLEKIDSATSLAELARAREKLGFGMTPQGTLRVFNPESLYALRLGMDDRLKFLDNEKSYPRIIFEALKLPYKGEEYSLYLDPLDEKFAANLLAGHGLDSRKPIVGIAPGAGHVFANKGWTVSGYIKLINRISDNLDAHVLLLGGEREKEANSVIREGLKNRIADIGCDYPLSRFMGIVGQCDMLICGDTLPMHIAIALKKQVLAIFGPTCHQEIDLFGRGEKIITAKECAPCYKGRCDIKDNCMELISLDEVYEAAKRLVAVCK
ncbi:MAG: glycosyltransferase family 9 protein [Nitrospinae bacterium]|nr:glycosyltransferase family 9 protein [Nitrospinota bacterium]